MELTSVRIKNFRTVGPEQTLTLSDGATMVGPNNSGKTNVLRAIQTLFTGHDNVLGYDRQKDLSFDAGTRVKTSLLATFDGDPDHIGDYHIYEKLDELHSLLGIERESTNFTLSLQFTESNNPTYQFFPNTRKPSGAQRTQYSRTERQLTKDLLNSFECHYVPSAKSVSDLYYDLLVPFLRRLAARAIQPHIQELYAALDGVASEITQELKAAGLEDITASFTLPGHSEEQLFSGFDLKLADPEETLVFQKGQGIQSTVLLASFLWITRQERAEGKSTIWLLEEPESYLHPELSRTCKAMLDKLTGESLVVTTTHSLSFVPKDVNHIVGTELSERRTILRSYRTFGEATQEIRAALGVRFSDFYSLDLYNIFVEGPTDRELIGWVLDVLVQSGDLEGCATLQAAAVEDFGGVSYLAGFLRATFPFIVRERPVVTVFDGDEAGSRERRNLQQYFGNVDVPFESGKHFVTVRDRFAIEGLFPDEWIVELHESHPSWFESFSVDSQGSLEPFRIKDRNKRSSIEWLRNRADERDPSEWAGRWIALYEAINGALDWQRRQLESIHGENL